MFPSNFQVLSGKLQLIDGRGGAAGDAVVVIITTGVKRFPVKNILQRVCRRWFFTPSPLSVFTFKRFLLLPVLLLVVLSSV